jgi:hypothetical protein
MSDGRALRGDAPWSFQTTSGQSFLRKGPSRSLASWARASTVTTAAGEAVLIELPADLLLADVVDADRDARADPHVLAAIEVGTLKHASLGERSAYRAAPSAHDSPHYALFPAVVGASLARSLLAARAGRRMPAAVVATIGIEVAAGLADIAHPGALTPDAIIVATNGHVQVRGALLQHLASTIAARAPLARPRLEYFAPELVRSGTTTMDSRGRLFALGVILWELATGRELLPDHPSAARMLADWSLEIPELPTDAPHELRAALWALLHRDPERRAQPAMLLELLAPLYEPGSGVALALEITAEGPAPYL